jgi:curli biogenesis system outer membrane secretion channel CsgG
MKPLRFIQGLAGALALIVLLSACTTYRASRALRRGILPVVAVTSFENRSGFEGQWKLGDGMSDLLVSELVQTKCFTVVEREQFGRIVDEISLQKHPYFRKEGRTEGGRLKGAHYQIRGVVGDFSQAGGAAVWVKLRQLAFGGRGYVARVSMTITLIEVESGRIIDSVQCTGTARARQIYGSAEYKNISFGGELFFKTPLGEATQEAVRQGVEGIIRTIPSQPWRPMVAEVRGNQVVLNGGQNRKINEGQLYCVRQPAVPVTDPETGDVLDYLPGPRVGTIRIMQSDKKLSYAERVDGQGFGRGQWLELINPIAEPEAKSAGSVATKAVGSKVR